MTFSIGAGMSGSIQLKHWTVPLAAPAIEQRLAILRRRNVSKRVANFIGIENARCVAVRIEKDERVRLVEIDILGQPVKRAGVIVLDVDGQTVRGCGCEGWSQRVAPQYKSQPRVASSRSVNFRFFAKRCAQLNERNARVTKLRAAMHAFNHHFDFVNRFRVIPHADQIWSFE